jgi:hypothetical protein
MIYISFSCPEPGVDINLNGRESGKKSLNNFFVNRICGVVLANRAAVLLAQEVTNIARAVFILHNHFVAAFSAIDNAMNKS